MSMGFFDYASLFIIALTVAVVIVGAAYLIAKVATISNVRRALERIVVGQIAMVVRQDLPLALALALAAESERGAARRRLTRIAGFLSQGLPLSRAVRLGFPDCSAIVVSLIVAGERSGRLADAVSQAEGLLIERDDARQQVDPSVGPYALFVLTFTVFVVTAMMLIVVPKLHEIYGDFGVAETSFVFSIARGLNRLAPLLMPAFISFVVVLLLGVFVRQHPRNTPVPGIAARIDDRIRWHLPGLRQLDYVAGMAVMLRAMRFAVRSGLRLDQAAQIAADVDVNWRLRRRVRLFAERLSAGAPPRDAARAAGLGDVTATALASGQRSGDMDAALRYAADYHAALMSRWWAMLGRLAWPLCTLGLASVVGVVIYGFFQPVVQLLDSVIRAGGG